MSLSKVTKRLQQLKLLRCFKTITFIKCLGWSIIEITIMNIIPILNSSLLLRRRLSSTRMRSIRTKTNTKIVSFKYQSTLQSLSWPSSISLLKYFSMRPAKSFLILNGYSCSTHISLFNSAGISSWQKIYWETLRPPAWEKAGVVWSCQLDHKISEAPRKMAGSSMSVSWSTRCRH